MSPDTVFARRLRFASLACREVGVTSLRLQVMHRSPDNILNLYTTECHVGADLMTRARDGIEQVGETSGATRTVAR